MTIPPAAPVAAGRPGELWALLETADELTAVWRSERREPARLAMRAAWTINITCPAARTDPQSAQPGMSTRCAPTVLSRNTEPEGPGAVEYRGACLGCGWVADQVHGFWCGGENAAAEDAHDHTHPAWRHLRVVARPPQHTTSPAVHAKAVAAWRARTELVLPAGWLDTGGPIRTHRAPCATRHVPAAVPGGGYDMSAGAEQPETISGQLRLFTDQPSPSRRGPGGRPVSDVGNEAAHFARCPGCRPAAAPSR